tara:strand:+ start:1373 stop:2356 length:984 start_codon:yes stop_codon:yes gene_type:complete
MNSIVDDLKSRILVLDGAMGTIIQTYNLEEEDFRGKKFKNHKSPLKGNNDLLSITQPEIIKEIHRGYLKAGADIIETNTFSSTSIAMEDYNLKDYVYELNYESAKIAKEVVTEFKEKKYVAGSIGPTNKTASMSPDVNDPGFRAIHFDELVASYKEQIKGLIEGGADILFIETVFDTLNAKAALMAVDNYFEENQVSVPIMISGTITDKSGRTLSGQTVNAFLISISHFPLLSIGFNCALGTKDLKPYMKRLSDSTNFFTSSHPNAGLPNAFGEYDQSPENMVEQLREYLEENLVNIIGGCCGTTFEHIKLIAEEVKKYNPRVLPNE